MQQQIAFEVPPEASHLGTFLAEFKGGSPANTKTLFVYPLILVLILTGLPLLAAIKGIKNAEIMLAISGGLCLFFLTMPVVGLLRMRGQVLLFRDGLFINRWKNRVACRWDEVEAVYQDVKHIFINGTYNHSEETYTLVRTNGEPIYVQGPLRNMEVLGEIIQEEMMCRQLPPAQQAMARGETLSFGELRINQEGIGHLYEEISWNELEGLVIKNGIFEVRRSGVKKPWIQLPVSKIPNVRVFGNLIAQATGKFGDDWKNCIYQRLELGH